MMNNSLRSIARNRLRSRGGALARPHRAHALPVSQTMTWMSTSARSTDTKYSWKPPTRGDWRSSPRQQQQPIRRLQPKKYSSLVYLPDTVSLQYPKVSPRDKNDNFSVNCVDFAISKPGTGGHVVLGRNGSGKSLVVKYLSDPELFKNTANVDNEDWKIPDSSEVAFVSFESHLKMMREQPHLTVHDSITGGTGNLSKAAQYLVVRFGLKSLLHRTLSTLSTGEIRKCLLVSALSKEPRLLVLENAFDGLDVESRSELKSIVSKTTKGLGKSGKLLVSHVNAEHVPPAQVFMSTHRPEEILEEVSTVSLFVSNSNDSSNQGKSNNLVTIKRPPGWSEEQIMYTALGLDKDHNKNENWKTLAPWEIDDATLPTTEELQEFWKQGQNLDQGESGPLITLDNVEIQRVRDGVTLDDEVNEDVRDKMVTLLQPLSWEVHPGQRWLIAGGNGAGKSTFSRFLVNHREDSNGRVPETNTDVEDTTCDFISGTYSKAPGATLGWVSTESHVGIVTLDSDEHTSTAWEVITQNGNVSESVAAQMVSWVFGEESQCDTGVESISTMLHTKTLDELSQGQQKLALLASAMALRPKVLILDEPTQGLDWVNRRRVLALLEQLCQATDTSLIYITHYEEEWIPSISHVLHLQNGEEQGRILYQGPKEQYVSAKYDRDM